MLDYLFEEEFKAPEIKMLPQPFRIRLEQMGNIESPRKETEETKRKEFVNWKVEQ